MVTVATSILTNSEVRMAADYLVVFGSNLSASATKFSWFSGSTSDNAVYIHGSDLSYSGSGNGRELAGGTISRIAIDSVRNNGSETAGDLVITGTEGLNVANIKKTSAQGFWNEILKGNDTFNLFGLGESDIGKFGSNSVFGDDFELLSFQLSEVDTGGNDSIYGADHELTMIGDVVTVAGNASDEIFVPATYYGGDDLIWSPTSDRRNTMIGDASIVRAFGEVMGGDDVLDASRNSNNATSLVGDAHRVEADGFVRGGNDELRAGRAEFLSGDVSYMSGSAAYVIGGDDTIHEGRFVSGDVSSISTSASACRVDAGDDRIVTAAPFSSGYITGDVGSCGSGHTIFGGDDMVSAGDGNDTVYGEVGAGANLANLIGGNDQLFGGKGDDQLSGQTGNDRLEGGIGADTLHGGDGIDLASYEASTSGVAVDLATTKGAGGDAVGDRLSGIERILGSDFADTLFGDGGANSLAGGLGSDTLDGRAGRDAFAGGGGPDFFVFAHQTHSGVGALRDVINDFSKAQADKINVSAIDAMLATAGNNAFTQFIGAAAFTGEGQIRAVQAGTSTVVEFNISGLGGADMQIQLLNFSAVSLQLGDFIV